MAFSFFFSMARKHGSGHIQSLLPSFINFCHSSVQLINLDHTYAKTKQYCDILPLNHPVAIINRDHTYSQTKQSCEFVLARNSKIDNKIHMPKGDNKSDNTTSLVFGKQNCTRSSRPHSSQTTSSIQSPQKFQNQTNMCMKLPKGKRELTKSLRIPKRPIGDDVELTLPGNKVRLIDTISDDIEKCQDQPETHENKPLPIKIYNCDRVSVKMKPDNKRPIPTFTENTSLMASNSSGTTSVEGSLSQIRFSNTRRSTARVSYSDSSDKKQVLDDNNVSFNPTRLRLIKKISEHIKHVKPGAVCAICGRILYMRTVKWVPNLPEDEWYAKNLIPEKSPVQIKTKHNFKGKCVSVCATCKTKVNSQKHTDFNFFNDYGQIPNCFSKLKSYSQFRKLSIGNVYCSTFKNKGYSYLHLHGNLEIQKNSKNNMRGMVGVLHDGECSELDMSTKDVKPCIHWLKKKNPLYKDFLSNLETIHGYAKTFEASGLFCGLPKRTGDLKIMNDGQLSASDLDRKTGLLIPSDKFNSPKEPCDLDTIVLGKAVERSKDMPKVQEITYGDPHLEAKLFPHLFPYGEGSWKKYKEVQALTMGHYHKHRLLHVDRRWANDRLYPFFAFDRNIKARLFYINSALASNKNRDNPLTSATLSDRASYFKYGNVINATITGSKAYWQKQLLDLVARVSKFGPGDIFFTLTFNEGWSPLKDILSQYDNKASILHPVEPTVYFFERFTAIKRILMGKDCVFGKVEHFWYRTEAQNRGALHFHGILWLKENTFVKDSIVSELPRGQDAESQNLRKMVQKYQVHHCLPNRCFRTWKGVATDKCKYGFPFSLRKEDGYDISGTKYEYKRSLDEDTRIVPYNPYLLMAWDGHLNVQRITRTGLERYLVKYVSKVEPTFGLEVEYDSEVSRYLQSRLVGAPEAIAMQLSLTMVASSDQVKFIDTNLPNDRTRPLKTLSEIEHQAPESNDIFVDGPREMYEKRPELPEFESMLYPTYICRYNLVRKKPRRKEPPTDADGRYVVKRLKPLIPGYRFLTVNDQDTFYYQQLLLKVPFRSENDLISVDNDSKTFKEECYLRELFIDKDELDVSFQEMKSRNFDPSQIAKIAKKMLHEGLSNSHTLSKKIRALDYGEDIPFENTELDAYESVPLEEPQLEMDSDIQKLVLYNKMRILEDKKDLAVKIHQLTESQAKVYDFISSHESEQILAFITGPGGTGKSFLLRTILLFFESAAKIVEVLATSGNAAKLIGGQTIHSFFKMSTMLETHFNYRDQTWSGISSTDVIIIDEVSMMSAELLEKIDLICREVSTPPSNLKPFGGKSIILFGDLYQLPAVVAQPCYRQIYLSPVWPQFKPFFLKDNCRQKGDLVFQGILNCIRDGTQTNDDIAVLQTRVCGKGHERTNECNDLANPYAFVLCSKHVSREKINEEIQEKTLKEQPLFQLRGQDYDEGGNRLSSEHSEDMDNIKGIMPKNIVVRKGAKVMITRNLDVAGGVVNGTVGILHRVHNKVLMVKTLDGSNTIPVPKVKQKMHLKKNGIYVYRVQFPVILAWACTVHKAQGMTLDKCFVYMDNTFFASGQAYVALSRVSEFKNLHLLSFSNDAFIASPSVSAIMTYAEETGLLKTAKTTHVQGKGNGLNSEMTPRQDKTSVTMISVNMHYDPGPIGETTIPMPVVTMPKVPVSSQENQSCTIEDESQYLVNKKEFRETQRQVYNTLRKEISHTYFNPNICPESITKVLELYKPTFVKFCNLFQDLPAFVTEANAVVDLHVQGELHPAVLEHYCPVTTTGDGNCLWNAVSLCLFNSEVHRLTLRLLTVDCMWNKQNFFLYLIGMDTIMEEGTLLQRFHKHLRIARNDKEWGNEFHILALSIVLQRDIYVYSSFRVNGNICLPSATSERLCEAFATHEHVGGHLLYTSPVQFKTQKYRQEPICLHFDMRRTHYSAILKKNKNATIFRPNTNLFNY